MEEEIKGETVKEARFNMALLYLQRVHDILNEITFKWLEGDLYSVAKLLTRLSIEVEFKLEPDELEVLDSFRKNIKPILDKCRNGKGTNEKDAENLNSQLYYYEVWLRRMLGKYKLLMPTKSESGLF